MDVSVDRVFQVLCQWDSSWLDLELKATSCLSNYSIGSCVGDFCLLIALFFLSGSNSLEIVRMLIAASS